MSEYTIYDQPDSELQSIIGIGQPLDETTQHFSFTVDIPQNDGGTTTQELTGQVQGIFDESGTFKGLTLFLGGATLTVLGAFGIKKFATGLFSLAAAELSISGAGILIFRAFSTGNTTKKVYNLTLDAGPLDLAQNYYAQTIISLNSATEAAEYFFDGLVLGSHIIENNKLTIRPGLMGPPNEVAQFVQELIANSPNKPYTEILVDFALGPKINISLSSPLPTITLLEFYSSESVSSMMKLWSQSGLEVASVNLVVTETDGSTSTQIYNISNQTFLDGTLGNDKIFSLDENNYRCCQTKLNSLSIS